MHNVSEMFYRIFTPYVGWNNLARRLLVLQDTVRTTPHHTTITQTGPWHYCSTPTVSIFWGNNPGGCRRTPGLYWSVSVQCWHSALLTPPFLPVDAVWWLMVRWEVTQDEPTPSLERNHRNHTGHNTNWFITLNLTKQSPEGYLATCYPPWTPCKLHRTDWIFIKSMRKLSKHDIEFSQRNNMKHFVSTQPGLSQDTERFHETCQKQ